jgi:hypothetical protein
MTWLHIPSTSSAFAQERPASILPSNWRSQMLARSVWWRGKPSPFTTWQKRCDKVSWVNALSGAMPEPSEADRGVALWMASLAESRVSLTRSPESAGAKMTNGISGQQPDASSFSADPGSSSSKTSRGCSPQRTVRRRERNGFAETYSSWVSGLREDCLRRGKLARAISARVSSSSAWPTPQARDGKGANQDELIDWGDSRPLNEIAVMWSTPRASDGEKGSPNQSFGAGGIPLAAQSVNWATPQVHDSVGGKTPEQVRSMRARTGAGVHNLNEQAPMWSSPSVGDVTGGHKSRSGDRKNEQLLNGQANALSSRPDLTTYPVGGISSPDRRSLNPLFVEWLMGWPHGWTLLGWTDFACSEMELSRWKARMRSALFALGLPDEGPPAQLSLFG